MRKRAEIENDYARSIASLVKVRPTHRCIVPIAAVFQRHPHFSQETKKTSAKYGEPTTGSLWIAFDRHVSEAGEVARLHSEFSRKVMADVHDDLFEFYNQKGETVAPHHAFCSLSAAEAQRSAVESRANELIKERTQAEAAAARAQENFYKVDKELGFLIVERDAILRAGNVEKAEKLHAKVEQNKTKLAQLRRDWVRLPFEAVSIMTSQLTKHLAGVRCRSLQRQSQQALHLRHARCVAAASTHRNAKMRTFFAVFTAICHHAVKAVPACLGNPLERSCVREYLQPVAGHKRFCGVHHHRCQVPPSTCPRS
jgi:hypothetical protein